MDTRTQLTTQVKSVNCFDTVIIGGGIHGASVAELAARNGLKVLLLERNDFASATSGRSSRMAHGGLRYLELFDFPQVFEGIRSRDELLRSAPDLVRAERFLIPIRRGDLWQRIKLGAGLFVYDLMLRDRAQRHHFVAGPNPAFSTSKWDLAGCFEYTDGLMDDSQLVLETLAAARKYGAKCLNYHEVILLQAQGEDTEIRVRDSIAGAEFSVRTKTVANCTGPWAGELPTDGFRLDLPQIKWSRGSHIVFNVPWKHPSLFLPLADKSRYYFVWPHRAGGTMVGTTEREISELPEDPLPARDEIDEIFERLAKDLPGSGLDRTSAYYAFAGIRTLPVRTGSSKTAEISRREIWKSERGIYSLVGGKFTTARHTAFRGLQLLFRSLRRNDPKYFEFELRKRSIANELSAQIGWAVTEDSAATLEDVMRRRLRLEECPGHGIDQLEVICKELEIKYGWSDIDAQALKYQDRMSSQRSLLTK